MNDLPAPLDNNSLSLQDISLVIRQELPVDRLPGYERAKHRVPQGHDNRSQAFVVRLGEQLVRDDLDATFETLRLDFGFKRRELQVTESDEGFGVIQTPLFSYSNCVFQSTANAREAVWQRELSQIRDPHTLLDETCNHAFATTFDAIEFVPSHKIQLAKLIDHIEDLTDDRVGVDYDRQLSYCKILLRGTPVIIHVNSDSFRVAYPEPTAPRELLRCMQDINAGLIDFRNLR